MGSVFWNRQGVYQWISMLDSLMKVSWHCFLKMLRWWRTHIARTSGWSFQEQRISKSTACDGHWSGATQCKIWWFVFWLVIIATQIKAGIILMDVDIFYRYNNYILCRNTKFNLALHFGRHVWSQAYPNDKIFMKWTRNDSFWCFPEFL